MVSRNLKKLNLVPISLICTTHKRPKKLYKLVESLKNNTFLPNEVIIVGTSKNDFIFINHKNYEFNINKLVSKKKNQIFQRNLGINLSKNPLIIQCDDDLTFDKDFILNFYKHFRVNKNKKKIIGALILNSKKKNQSDRWNNIYRNSYLFRKILKVLNKFENIKYMSLLASGRIAPLLPLKIRNQSKNFRLEKLEWLSSTLCYNKNIVKRKIHKINYKSQKSYFEDVFFTHHNFNKGFNLVLDGKVVCYHDTISPTNFKEHWGSIFVQWQLVKFFKKNKILFFIDAIIFSIVYFFKDQFKLNLKSRK